MKLKYPEKLIDSAINRLRHPPDQVTTPSDSPVRIIMPYKDQKLADAVRRQLCDLGVKINQQLQYVDPGPDRQDPGPAPDTTNIM